MDHSASSVWEHTLRHALPALPPYEFKLYLILLANTHLLDPPVDRIRVGKRTLASDFGTATRSSQPNYWQVDKKLKALEEIGCIVVGDTNREGTEYLVRAPADVPVVAERMANEGALDSGSAPSHFTDPALRLTLFERDGWRCRYCGERVTEQTVTLDHVIPQSSGGTDDPDNLATACLMCNSVKSGRSLTDAAPALLDAIRRRTTAED